METNFERVTRTISDFLQTHRLTGGENTLLAAFSGGADSLCMLDALSTLRNKYEFKLAAAHLNHNWRGDESRQEAEKAETYCREKEIEFHTKTLQAGLPQTEETAREERYKFFNEVAAEISANAILTGHTASDNTETVLYRIIKGTGTAGLAGIPEVRKQSGGATIYRPILGLKRKDCEEYCREQGLEPNFDPSNYDEKYLRNRIRHKLLPELQTYNPAITDSLLRLAHIAGDTENILEEYITQIKSRIYAEDFIHTAMFLQLPDALKKRILVEYLGENDIEHTYERIEDVLGFIKENAGSKSGKTFSIAKDRWLFVSSPELKIIDHTKAEGTSFTVPVKLEGESFHPELGITIKTEKWSGNEPESFPKEDSKEIYVDLSKVEGELYLRTRKPGDVIQPFGMKEQTKLKKYLINRGVPEHMRDELPLLTTGDEVLWVVGIGISEQLRVTETPTHVIEIKPSYQ